MAGKGRPGFTPGTRDLLIEVYQRLETHYELDRWHWAPDTPALDICIGAILVQHTAWVNVEKALMNLKARGLFSLEGLRTASEEQLAALLRPAGMPLTKARRVQTFAALVEDAGGFDVLLDIAPDDLRRLLLATPGIGPETADVILLYAAGVPVALHDAYTARLMRRLGTGVASSDYASWAAWQETVLPIDLRLRRRFHAAVVVHCKERCKSMPRCQGCPLLDVCPHGRARIAAGAEVELSH